MGSCHESKVNPSGDVSNDRWENAEARSRNRKLLNQNQLSVVQSKTLNAAFSHVNDEERDGTIMQMKAAQHIMKADLSVNE